MSRQTGLRVVMGPNGQEVSVGQYIDYLESCANPDELRRTAIRLARELDAYITATKERNAWVLDQVRAAEACYKAELEQAQSSARTAAAPVVTFEPGAISLSLAVEQDRRGKVITVTDGDGHVTQTATVEAS
jgi:hypothetical protein